MAPGLRSLKDLPSDQPVYRGVTSDGDLLFQANLRFHSTNKRREHVTERFLVALALTEVCCEIGRGKVYYFPMPDSEVYNNAKDGAIKTTTAYFFHKLPKLIYVPFAWGEEDQRLWRQIPHEVRLDLLNARNGGIMRKDCVMPIDLAYQITEDEDVRLNGYNGADTGTKALLAITPKAYLGWCTELQDKPDEFTFARSSMEDGQGAWFVANLETLRKYQQGSAEAVLDRLWDMYFEGEPRSLVKFEDILRGVIEFHAAWTQLHFTRRQKDNIEDGRSEKRVVARRKGGSP